MRTLIWSFILFAISIVVTAQTTPCPVLFQHAVDQTEDVCSVTGRNQACYGNNIVNLIPFDDVGDVNFNMPGDVADVEKIRVLSLSALNDATGEWGITMMRLLANLDPSTADDVTLLLFGDVEIETATEQTASSIATTTTVANIRRYPTTAAIVVASLPSNSELSAMGQNADGTWIQVHDGLSNVSGWIHSDLLTIANQESLDIVESSQPYFGPMQAFYFRGQNTNNGLSCNSLPSDGLLIQTPEGVGRVTIWINQVTVDFLSNTGSTAFVSPPVDDTMTIDILEGSATISSDQGGYVTVAGSSVSIEKIDDMPEVNPPQPTDALFADNSLTTALDRDVEPFSANVETIAAFNGLTLTQYEELQEFGFVITIDESTTTSSNTAGGNGSTDGTGTNSETSVGNDSAESSSDDPATGDTGSDGSNPAESDDCPGNSCNAPGQNNDDDCPGNSCNAPGQNDDDDECPGNSCNAPGQNKDKDKDKKKVTARETVVTQMGITRIKIKVIKIKTRKSSLDQELATDNQLTCYLFNSC